MSLVSMPFAGGSADTVLHVAATVMMVAVVGAALYGFWKLHEMPLHHAKKNEHRQLALITVLTWIGFIWHWVWVLAVIIAFIDGAAILRSVRDIWREPTPPAQPEGDHD
ncbi:MFS transporter [Ferrimonas senticii]|uniref:MFS transporter n=1 Tax=Ferrimonas senticii TaxID=394566 RepID=UPI000413D705|nr:MFS transporter [Ferrimonas senticii]